MMESLISVTDSIMIQLLNGRVFFDNGMKRIMIDAIERSWD